MVTLGISIVSHAPNACLLAATLDSLRVALLEANDLIGTQGVRLYLVDNGPAQAGALLDALCSAVSGIPGFTVTLVRGQGNVGYGAGHNLAIRQSDSTFHLILNPDVELRSDSLREALTFMAQHPEVGLLSPAVRDAAGQLQYLCRRYPGVLDLGLRGFAPAGLQRRFRARLSRYTMQDVIGPSEVVWDVPLVSGCFMLLRRPVLESTGGFDPGFFLYFEDYDLSLRVAGFSRIVYVPRVAIVHHGGQAARKGWHHIGWFMRSALRFYRKHGWAW